MLNRAAVIIRYKQPFVDWINTADPNLSHPISLEAANEDSTAYLIEVEGEEELEDWLELNAEIMFENELNGWYTDPKLWPEDRSIDALRQWCTLELHSVVIDTGGSPLYDDDDELDADEDEDSHSNRH